MKTNLLMMGLLSLTVFVGQPLEAKASELTEFEKWKKKHNKQVSNYVEQYDKDFASFLKNRWVEAEVVDGEKRDLKPKPKQTPTKQSKPVIEQQPVEIVLPDIVPDATPDIAPEQPPVPKAKPKAKPKTSPVVKSPFDYAQGQKSLTMSLIGQQIVMPKIELPRLAINKLSSANISELWLAMAGSEYQVAIAAIKQASDDLKLDDWGNALLTHKYLTQLERLNQNQRQLLSWFYLVKQGFDARVAFDKNQVYLLLHTKQTLFGQKFFTFDKQKYYFVDFAQTRPVQVGSVYTYEQQHSSATQSVSVDMSVAPLQGDSDKVRTLVTKINNQEISISAPYNSEYVAFLDFYPQVSMATYFKAELPEQTKVSLLSQLKQKLEGLSELQAVNFLLHFVQSSLQYKTDQEQFNYENYLFAGETLHYPYADCEDRSVLFAYLVKHLLGNKVVGLEYKGHVATAVALKSQINGNSFLLNDVRYTIADPTYINANVGETMTGYEGVEPKLVIF